MAQPMMTVTRDAVSRPVWGPDTRGVTASAVVSVPSREVTDELVMADAHEKHAPVDAAATMGVTGAERSPGQASFEPQGVH